MQYFYCASSIRRGTRMSTTARSIISERERMRMSSELRVTFSDYTREYIRLRKETNRLLRERKIDKHEANHRNGNAKQFLMFARYQLEAAKKTSTSRVPQTRPITGS